METDRPLEQIAQQFADVFESTWNDRDGPAYGKAYWPDAELVDPTGAVWAGRDAIADMHVNLWRGPASNTHVAASVRGARALSATLAIVDLDVEVSGFSPTPPGAVGGPDGIVRTRLKHVIEERGSEWKILASQNTFVAAVGG